MIATIIAIFHLLGIISSVHAVMDTRTTQGTIAWVISLNTFPYIAVPAYWILGRSRFKGYVKAHRASEQHIARYEHLIETRLAPYRMPVSNVVMAAEKLAEMPQLKANHVDLLVDGQVTFDSIIQGIDGAEDYILFQFFIIHADDIGHRVKSHLINKAKQGVRVYFLYDEIGSHSLPDAYMAELKKVGFHVSAFRTRKGRGNKFQINPS